MGSFDFAAAISGALSHAVDAIDQSLDGASPMKAPVGHPLIDHLRVNAINTNHFQIYFSGSHAATEARFIHSLLNLAGATRLHKQSGGHNKRHVHFNVMENEQEKVAAKFNELAERLVAEKSTMTRIQSASYTLDQLRDSKLGIRIEENDTSGKLGFALSVYTANDSLIGAMKRANFESQPVDRPVATSSRKPIQNAQGFAVPADRLDEALAVFEGFISREDTQDHHVQTMAHPKRPGGSVSGTDSSDTPKQSPLGELGI